MFRTHEDRGREITVKKRREQLGFTEVQQNQVGRQLTFDFTMRKGKKPENSPLPDINNGQQEEVDLNNQHQHEPRRGEERKKEESKEKGGLRN